MDENRNQNVESKKKKRYTILLVFSILSLFLSIIPTVIIHAIISSVYTEFSQTEKYSLLIVGIWFGFILISIFGIAFSIHKLKNKENKKSDLEGNSQKAEKKINSNDSEDTQAKPHKDKEKENKKSDLEGNSQKAEKRINSNDSEDTQAKPHKDKEQVTPYEIYKHIIIIVSVLSSISFFVVIIATSTAWCLIPLIISSLMAFVLLFVKKKKKKNEKEDKISFLTDKYYDSVKNLIEQSSEQTHKFVSEVDGTDFFAQIYENIQNAKLKKIFEYDKLGKIKWRLDNESIKQSIFEINTFVNQLKDRIQNCFENNFDTQIAVYYIIRNNIIRYWHDYYKDNRGWKTVSDLCDHSDNIEKDLSMATFCNIYEKGKKQSIGVSFSEIVICAKKYIKSSLEADEARKKSAEENRLENLYFNEKSSNNTILQKESETYLLRIERIKNIKSIFEDTLPFSIINEIVKKPKHRSILQDIISIDMMTGSQFEEYIGKLFRKKGYSIRITPASGDYGIDVIATSGSERIGIQCKRYNHKVSNSAVQEVVAGMQHYGCNRGMVITNNYFQPSAITLANENGIILWDRNCLMREIKSLQ